jgi:putative inorganic carbon (hco3(-)) transporter
VVEGVKQLAAMIILLASAGYLIWRIDPAYTLSAAIALSPLAGNWQQFGVPGILAPDRLLLVGGIAQVFLRAPAIRDRPPLRPVAAHWLLALAALYAVGSAFFAQTLFHAAPLAKIIDTFGVTPFLTFVVAPLVFRSDHQRSILLVALVGLGCYLGLTVWFETIHIDALVFPKYILNPNYGIHVLRGRGPFVDAVANGFAMFVCAVACGVAAATWSRRRSQVIAVLIGLLCLTGSVLSLERSVWIGAAVATIVTMMAAAPLRRYFLPTVAVVAVSIVAALALIPGLAATVSFRANQVGTVWDRQNLITAGINMVEARPLFGFGWSRFMASSTDYFRQSPNYPLVATDAELHNTPLVYTVELGLIGATLWGLGLLTGVGGALLARGPPELRPWRVGLLAVAIIFAVVANSVPPTAFMNLSLWLWAGVVVSGRYPLATGERPPGACQVG